MVQSEDVMCRAGLLGEEIVLIMRFGECIITGRLCLLDPILRRAWCLSICKVVVTMRLIRGFCLEQGGCLPDSK